MSSELVLKWGVISAGLISQDFVTAVKTLESKYHVFQAIFARKLEDAQKFAQTYGVTTAYDSYDSLLADPEVNIVYIGSVNHVHKEQCLKAINAGKHILCEKPMTLNEEEQEEVLTAAEKKGIFFMEGLWTRFFPIISRLKKELDDGTIGDLNHYVGNFMVPIKGVDRLNKKELGGGALLDIGIYPIQLACLVFNHEKPTSIVATGHLMPSGVDECCTVVLTFPGQRIATINISTNCAMFGASFFCGTKGYIQIPEFSWCPEQLILPNKEVVVEKLPEVKTNFGNSVGLRFEAEEIRLAIAQGLTQHPKAAHDHSRLIMHIISESKKQLGYTDLA